MRVCVDKTCEGVLCEECKDLKPSICGDRGLPMPNDNCDVIRFEGVEDTEINQGVCIDLTEGIHAYDGDGSEIPYTVSPSEIGCCDVGEHEITYTAMGKGNKMLPSFCLGKPMLTTANCGLMTKAVTRLVTVLQALPPKILGIGRTIIPPSTTFDPMSGVSGVDDNGNETEVTYEGRYDLSTGKQNIASFESDIEQNAKSLKVVLEPIQSGSGTPSPDNVRPISGRTEVVTWNDPMYGGTIEWNQLVKNGDFDGTTSWSKEYGNISASNNELTYTATSIGVNFYENQVTQYGFSVPSNHVVFMTAETYAPYSNGFYMSMRTNNVGQSGVGISNVPLTPNIWNRKSKVAKLTNNLTDIAFYWNMNTNYHTGDSVKLRNVMLLDLTQMFGSTKAEEIYAMEQAHTGDGVAYIESLFPLDYYAYNAGETTCVSAVNGNPYYTYTTDLGRTVYGGTLDVVSGVLIVNRAMVTLDGTQSFVSQGNLTNTKHYSYDAPNMSNSPSVYSADVISDKMPTIADNSDAIHINHRNVGIHIWIPSDKTPSVWFAENPTIVVYPIATPQTIQLTPQEVQLLLGTNNVWSDGGEVEVIYSKPFEGATQLDIEGVYPITYHTEDSCGNETTETRCVFVTDDDISVEDTYAVACQGKTCYAVISCDEA